MKHIYLLVVVIGIACSSNNAKIENEKKGKLKATHKLVLTLEKKFLLDDNTAPKPLYIQLYEDSTGKRRLTFLNTYNNGIYFYDYENGDFLDKVIFDRQGPNGILRPEGYYMLNKDTIYIYNMHYIELVRANLKGEVLQKISLIQGENIQKAEWVFHYPQYQPQTVNPFIKVNDELFLTGQLMETVPEKLIDKFKFTARFNIKTNEVDYLHSYPGALYGNGYNWDDQLFTEVFPALHPDGDKFIYSFPVSHNVYLAGKDSNHYKKIYAGSNFAGTIKSLEKPRESTTLEMLRYHYVKEDLYGAILYDQYRHVYYRFLQKGVPNASIHTQLKAKEISVVILDEDFEYLGETTLGPAYEWNWRNSFVSEAGLNVEYFDLSDTEELFLNLKIFTPDTI